MNASIRTLKACLRQLSLQMSHVAIARNERVSQNTLHKIKKISESTNLSIFEILQKEDDELVEIFQLKTKKNYQKKLSILPAEKIGG